MSSEAAEGLTKRITAPKRWKCFRFFPPRPTAWPPPRVRCWTCCGNAGCRELCGRWPPPTAYWSRDI